MCCWFFFCFLSLFFLFFFFFSSRRRHTRSDRDRSSDVCSSDLASGALYLLRFEFAAPVLAGAAALALARRRVASCAQRAEGERRPSDGATSELRAAFAACD